MRRKVKVKVAESLEEAESELRAYCDKLDFDPKWIGPEQWKVTLRIACEAKNGGLDEAKRTIDQDLMDITSTAARGAREAEVTADQLPRLLAGRPRFRNSTAREILAQLTEAYIAGKRVNLMLGGAPLNPPEYERLRTDWKKVGKEAAGLPACIFTGFVAHRPQDKNAEGRGNAGDTMDKRKYQGDLLVNICGVTFNMHVNTTGLEL